ncbi:hypothetical protein B0H17DRAFT_253635 [Mycena rosella]|uniref:F-box domain-containing protein n=1 Tax=Mycena rosella TaxID=1033263 RepID=A0AAD7CY10_MYCRO|nr:hypothetical protein B0H17DRAFT_253635 [Mycena rosella]
MPRLFLCDLPQEILLEVLTLLDGKSLLLSCPSVCRLWKNIIDSSTDIQYTLELWADGFIVGASGNSSAVEKLKALHERRRAWLSLNWSSRTVIPIDPTSRAYELVDGVFAQLNVGIQSFTAVWLPSALDHVPKTTSNSDLGIDPRDFVIDPTQDLVAFVYEHPEDSANVECRTLLSLKPHPLATLPLISFPVTDFPLGPLCVDLADDVIGLFFASSGRVVLLNWRTGRIIADIASPDSFAWSFSLLSPRAFILGHGAGSGELQIWSFEDNVPNHVASLQLPRVIEDGTLEYLVTHSGSFRAKPAVGKSFSKSNERRLCVVSLEYADENYSLFIPHRHFQKYLSKTGGDIIVPWDDWGPQYSRMLLGMPNRWLRYVHGERVVLPPTHRHPNVIEILDFGMSAFRPGANVDMLQAQSTCELHAEPSTIIDDAGTFEDDVTTSLPYRRIVRWMDQAHPIFLIDEDQLIGVNDSESQITVYTF